MRFFGAAAFVLFALAAPRALADADEAWAAYERGDYAGAFAAFSDLAGQGDADAMFGLGWLHASGRGTPRDDAAAVRWFTRAAGLGHAAAQTSLGYHYDLGLGVVRDAARAEDLYRKAADAGSLVAANNLAYGWAVEGRNLDEALRLIRSVLAEVPEEPASLDTLGWILYRMGRFDEAVPPLCSAALRDARNPEILTHLGDALWRVGRPIEAQQAWRQALTLIENPALLSDAGADQLRAQGADSWLGALRPRLADGLPPDPGNAGALPGAGSDPPMPDECAALTS